MPQDSCKLYWLVWILANRVCGRWQWRGKGRLGLLSGQSLGLSGEQLQKLLPQPCVWDHSSIVPHMHMHMQIPYPCTCTFTLLSWEGHLECHIEYKENKLFLLISLHPMDQQGSSCFGILEWLSGRYASKVKPVGLLLAVRVLPAVFPNVFNIAFPASLVP